MKHFTQHLFLLFVLLLSCPALCQFEGLPRDEHGKINITDVVKTDSVGRDALFIRAKQWFAESFKNADRVIKMEDRQEGIFIGKGSTTVTIYAGIYSTPMFFTVGIYLKDNRYKYEITDLYYKASPTQANNYSTLETPLETLFTQENKDSKRKSVQKYMESYRAPTVAQLKAIEASLRNAMTGAHLKSKTDF